MFQRFCLIMLSLIASGCANISLYRPADDEAAQKAKNAVIAANLKDALQPEREALLDFGRREQEAARHAQISIRNRKLIAVLTATDPKYGWDTITGDLNERCDEITGVGKTGVACETGIKIETQTRLIEDAQKKLKPQVYGYLLATRGRVKLQCPLLDSQRPKVEESELKFAYQPFEQTCKTLTTANKELDALLRSGGALKDVFDKVDGIRVARKAHDAELEAAKIAYNAALRAAEVPTAEPSKLDELAAALTKAYDRLVSAAKPDKLVNDKILSRILDEGKAEQLKARQAAVEKLIQALRGTAEADAKPAFKRLAALSNFDRAITTDSYPQISALILQAEFLKQEADLVQKHISRANERIKLFETRRDLMVEELVFVNQAKKEFGTFSQSTNCKKQASLYQSFLDATPNCRFHLASGLAAYVNAMTLGRAEQEVIDYQLMEQAHDAALDDSEVALAQTDNLLRVPVEQIARITSERIKPNEVAEFFSAFGVTAIAVRMK